MLLFRENEVIRTNRGALQFSQTLCRYSSTGDFSVCLTRLIIKILYHYPGPGGQGSSGSRLPHGQRHARGY